jgi:hypothetical protein
MKFSGMHHKKQEKAIRTCSTLLPRNDNPHCATPGAVAALFLPHRCSGSAAFQATGDKIQFLL